MRYLCCQLLLVGVMTLAPDVARGEPIISGTIFMDADIIVSSDASTLDGIVFAGVGDRLMFDRRLNAFAVYTAFLFNATFADGLMAEIQVNSEFGTTEAALAQALSYGTVIGQLPNALRSDLETVWIHQGVELFGGGNNSLLIHTGQGALYAADGILEEALVHEGAHTSLDPSHAASPGWLSAQAADGDFMSTYASDFPDREDIAESFLPWAAVRYRSDRISSNLASEISTTIPNRLAYFDAQGFDTFPVTSPTSVPEPGTLSLLLGGIGSLLLARFKS